MKKIVIALVFALLFSSTIAWSQTTLEISDVVGAITKEANENSQLERLAHELMDVNGPRLVGTPQMKTAHDWAIKEYAKWGY